MKNANLADTWALQLELSLEEVYPEATRAQLTELTKNLLDSCKPGAIPLTKNKRLFSLLLKLNREYSTKKERVQRLNGVKEALSTLLQAEAKPGPFDHLNRFTVHRPRLVGGVYRPPLSWFQQVREELTAVYQWSRSLIFKRDRRRAQTDRLDQEYLSLCIRLEELNSVDLMRLSQPAAEAHCAEYVRVTVQLRDVYLKQNALQAIPL